MSVPEYLQGLVSFNAESISGVNKGSRNVPEKATDLVYRPGGWTTVEEFQQEAEKPVGQIGGRRKRQTKTRQRRTRRQRRSRAMRR